MQVDDYPYGGGRGAVMQADPLFRCWEHVVNTYGPGRTIFMSPCGRTFTQSVARELKAQYDHLILVCGHYEGIDQRFIDACVDEELSMGDFVLTGGEILTCQEAKGREQLATMLAGQQGMSVEQARAILAAAAPQQPVASTQSEADRIMACEEANGREQLAATLAAMPEMTVEKARPILAASPQADAGPSLRDQIMALDEAKGAEAQAEQLAACPGMTVESARAVLAAGSGKAEPVSASTTALFERIMANHSPAAVQGGVPQTSADGDADVKMLMAMP